MTDEFSSKLVGSASGGTYCLQKTLGVGALGVVYLARQEHLDRDVAVKLIRDEYAAHPRFSGALRREARAGSRIEHCNVARTYDFGLDEKGRCFLVMELLHGESLEKILLNVPRPPVEWTVSIAAQVLAGVAAAHDRGVIHRDIKPGNVVIETTLDDDEQPIDVAKLCDFGIADIAGDGTEDDAADAADGAFDPTGCGTPNYMAPEQAQGQPCTPHTDIYACGVMLFEMATGQVPFEGSTPSQTAALHVSARIPRPRALCPDIDRGLERIILRAMAKRPEARYPSARAMRADLLALACAKRSTSLLDDWADQTQPDAIDVLADTGPRLVERRPSRSGGWPWPSIPLRGRADGAVWGACALVLCVTLVWQQLQAQRSGAEADAGATPAAATSADMAKVRSVPGHGAKLDLAGRVISDRVVLPSSP